MTASITLGALRAKVEVQTISMAAAAGGGTTRTYSTVATLRGAVADVGGRALLASGVSTSGGPTARVIVRAEYAIKKDHRLLIDGVRRLAVQRVEAIDDRGRYLRLWCEDERT